MQQSDIDSNSGSTATASAALGIMLSTLKANHDIKLASMKEAQAAERATLEARIGINPLCDVNSFGADSYVVCCVLCCVARRAGKEIAT